MKDLAGRCTHRIRTHLIVATAGVCLLCVCASVTSRAAERTQPPQAAARQPGAGISIWSGVYTDTQAKRGELVAKQYCVACHGMELMGGDSGPALVGNEFLGNWSMTTAGDLFDQIHTMMPADMPGSLTLQEYADVTSYIFQLNKLPTGEKELPTDMPQLNQISIEAQPPAK